MVNFNMNHSDEAAHEKLVSDVAYLIEEAGKLFQKVGFPQITVAQVFQNICNYYGVTMQEVAVADTTRISWTCNFPSAMETVKKDDPAMYAYCVENRYEVQNTGHGLIVTGGPDDDPCDMIQYPVFQAMMHAIWNGQDGFQAGLETLIKLERQ